MKLRLSDDLSLPIEAVTQTFAILAKRGVGKTYTGAVMVEEMLTAEQQVVVCDPIGVWWGLRSSADGKQPGFPIVVFGGEHADIPLEEHAGETICSAIIEHGFSAVLDLSILRKGQQTRFMTAFAETLYRLNRKPLHLVVDEADAFAPQRPMNDEARLLGAFEDIVRRGRARGLGVTLITQRAAVINKNVLTQIEVLIALRTISPQDREALQAWTEVHGSDKKQEQFWESLASLPIGTAWFWSPGWLDIFKRVQIRARKTFDSSSTPKVGEAVRKPKALAEVNLEHLGAQIKATAEKAKENDVGLLKRTKADLQKQIATLEQKLANQKAPATKIERKEIPVLKDRQVERLLQAAEKLQNLATVFSAEASEIRTAVKTATQPVFVGQPPRVPAVRQITLPVDESESRKILVRAPVVRRPEPAMGPGDSPDNAQQKILDTIAMLNARGLTPNREMVARWMDIHPNGGRYGTNLAWLREQGYLDGFVLTAKGSAAARPMPTGITAVNDPLDGAQRQIIEKLVNGETYDRETLAQALGIHPNGGRYGSNLARLRTMGVIPERGTIQLTPQAFA